MGYGCGNRGGQVWAVLAPGAHREHHPPGASAGYRPGFMALGARRGRLERPFHPAGLDLGGACVPRDSVVQYSSF